MHPNFNFIYNDTAMLKDIILETSVASPECSTYKDSIGSIGRIQIIDNTSIQSLYNINVNFKNIPFKTSIWNMNLKKYYRSTCGRTSI